MWNDCLNRRSHPDHIVGGSQTVLKQHLCQRLSSLRPTVLVSSADCASTPTWLIDSDTLLEHRPATQLFGMTSGDDHSDPYSDSDILLARPS